jgi:hypothetical protein
LLSLSRARSRSLARSLPLSLSRSLARSLARSLCLSLSLVSCTHTQRGVAWSCATIARAPASSRASSSATRPTTSWTNSVQLVQWAHHSGRTGPEKLLARRSDPDRLEGWRTHTSGRAAAAGRRRAGRVAASERSQHVAETRRHMRRISCTSRSRARDSLLGRLVGRLCGHGYCLLGGRLVLCVIQCHRHAYT